MHDQSQPSTYKDIPPSRIPIGVEKYSVEFCYCNFFLKEEKKYMVLVNIHFLLLKTVFH